MSGPIEIGSDGFRPLEKTATFEVLKAEIENTILPRLLIFRNDDGQTIRCFAESGRIVVTHDGSDDLAKLRNFAKTSQGIAMRADIISQPSISTGRSTDFSTAAEDRAIALLTLKEAKEIGACGDELYLKRLRSVATTGLIGQPSDKHFAAYSNECAGESFIACTIDDKMYLAIVAPQETVDLHEAWLIETSSKVSTAT